MKRFLSFMTIFVLAMSFFASAESVDLTAMSYEELVALRDQINLAIWNSSTWEEVDVPQGVYVVGSDIPAGHWTVKCSEDWFYTSISWGEKLTASEQDIEWSERSSIYNFIYNPDATGYEIGLGATDYSFEVKDGEYIIIQYGSATFTPYAGKKEFNFKAFADTEVQENADESKSAVTPTPEAVVTPEVTSANVATDCNGRSTLWSKPDGVQSMYDGGHQVDSESLLPSSWKIRSELSAHNQAIVELVTLGIIDPTTNTKYEASCLEIYEDGVWTVTYQLSSSYNYATYRLEIDAQSGSVLSVNNIDN